MTQYVLYKWVSVCRVIRVFVCGVVILRGCYIHGCLYTACKLRVCLYATGMDLGEDPVYAPPFFWPKICGFLLQTILMNYFKNSTPSPFFQNPGSAPVQSSITRVCFTDGPDMMGVCMQGCITQGVVYDVGGAWDCKEVSCDTSRVRS